MLLVAAWPTLLLPLGLTQIANTGSPASRLLARSVNTQRHRELQYPGNDLPLWRHSVGASTMSSHAACMTCSTVRGLTVTCGSGARNQFSSCSKRGTVAAMWRGGLSMADGCVPAGAVPYQRGWCKR